MPKNRGFQQTGWINPLTLMKKAGPPPPGSTLREKVFENPNRPKLYNENS